MATSATVTVFLGVLQEWRCRCAMCQLHQSLNVGGDLSRWPPAKSDCGLWRWFCCHNMHVATTVLSLQRLHHGLPQRRLHNGLSNASVALPAVTQPTALMLDPVLAHRAGITLRQRPQQTLPLAASSWEGATTPGPRPLTSQPA